MTKVVSLLKKIKLTASNVGFALMVLTAAMVMVAIWHIDNPPVSTADAKPSVITVSTDTPGEDKPGNDYLWRGSANDPKRITMPGIDLKAFIVQVGVDQNKQIAVPNNIHIAGWFVDSVKPGDKGLSIIDGHVNGRKEKGVFKDIERLKAGDQYRIDFADGLVREFVVRAVTVVPNADAAGVLFSQDPTIERQVNLITCAGRFDPAARIYDKRVIVVSEFKK